MKLAFILDPLDALKTGKDTSLAIMREAAQRGHSLFVAEQSGLALRNGQAQLQAAAFHFAEGASSWFQLEQERTYAPASLDAIMMRKDPPFDTEYIYSTYLLELAENQGARIFNRPRAIRDWNEKLSVARFPQFTPAFLVTRHIQAIRDFLEEQSDIVVKPLDGMGGSGVFRLHRADHNIGVILETITHYERRTVMAQRYLPEIKDGDKRILVIDGTPLPYVLARIPKQGETRGNLAAGGKGVAQPLSPRDREIAETVGKALKQEGLFLAGLDVIGDSLTEINVTSPTGMVEIAAQTDCNPASVFMDALEHAC